MKLVIASIASCVLALSGCSSSASADVLSTSIQSCVDSEDLNTKYDRDMSDVVRRFDSLGLLQLRDATAAVEDGVVTLFLACMSEQSNIDCVDTHTQDSGNLAECHEVGKPDEIRILNEFLPAM